MHRTMTHADAKTKASIRQLMDQCCSLRIIERLPKIDRCYRGAEGNFMGGEGKRLTQPHAVAHAGTIDTSKTFVFETMRDFKRRLSPFGHRGETHCWFLRHWLSPSFL